MYPCGYNRGASDRNVGMLRHLQANQKLFPRWIQIDALRNLISRLPRAKSAVNPCVARPSIDADKQNKRRNLEASEQIQKRRKLSQDIYHQFCDRYDYHESVEHFTFCMLNVVVYCQKPEA